MTPTELAEIHAACFSTPRPWTAEEFVGFLALERTVLCLGPDGFALGQLAGPEVELLTISVRPRAQGQGQGRKLLSEFLDQSCSRGAQDAFLEVLVNNAAAIALYISAGFTESGLRKDYYQAPNGQKSSSLLMRKSLNNS